MVDYDERTALIVTDIQNDFADPKGNLYVHGGERAAAGRGRDLTEAGGNNERACDQRGSCYDAVNL